MYALLKLTARMSKLFAACIAHYILVFYIIVLMAQQN